MSDVDELAREVDELPWGASAEVEVRTCSDVAGEQNIGMSVTVGDRTARHVSMKRRYSENSLVAPEK